MYARFYRINLGIHVVKNDAQKEVLSQEYELNELLNEIFKKISSNLTDVLCEVYSGIRDLTNQTYVSQNVSRYENDEGKEEALKDTSTLRDWLVYREYITQLEVSVRSLEILNERANGK